MNKPPRNFWQIWNMSFGFLGIQFGWGLQMANMSAIYEYLGAKADQIPILWLAAPLTGLIIQPIIGHASDRTWGFTRTPPSLLPHGCAAQFRSAHPHAEQLRALDGGRPLMGARRLNQCQHGAFPRLRRRSTARTTAHARFRHAEPLHRAWSGSGLSVAMAPAKCISCNRSSG